MWPLMGPRTVKFPKKGPHFSRFEDEKKVMKKREKERERKKKRKKMEKSGKMKEERETSYY